MSNTIESIKATYLAAYEEQKKQEKVIEAEAEKARAAALWYQRLAAQNMGSITNFPPSLTASSGCIGPMTLCSPSFAKWISAPG